MSDQLYCVLIATEGDTLLLPNAMVAETVGLDALTADGPESHWKLGSLEWNRQRIPAVRFEVANGAAAQPLGRRARLVVVQPLEGSAIATPLALLAQGYPHLITVTRQSIQPQPLRPEDDPELVLTRLSIGNTQALVPDIDALRRRWQARVC